MTTKQLINDLINAPSNTNVFIMSGMKEHPITALTKTLNNGLVRFTLLFNESQNNDKNYKHK